MKKVLCICFSFLSLLALAQEETNFKAESSAIWTAYREGMHKFFELYQNHPEKKDSLMQVAAQLEQEADSKSRALAIKYAATPEGLQSVYMLRLSFSKDTLQTLLSTLPVEMQQSYYGKTLQLHLDTEQIETGSPMADFEIPMSGGGRFLLSSLSGKHVLFLYGGLGCMGAGGRAFLNTLYKNTSREKLEIVVYCICADQEELNKIPEMYPCEYYLVSDFLLDHSPIKIRYGAQATPTTFLIDPQGKVVLKTIAVNEELISEALNYPD